MSTEDENAEVTLGCKITIRNEAKEIKTYMYDLQHGFMPELLNVFTGHKTGDSVELLGDTWKIEDIVL